MSWLGNLVSKLFNVNSISALRNKVNNCPFMKQEDKDAILKIIEKYLV